VGPSTRSFVPRGGRTVPPDLRAGPDRWQRRERTPPGSLWSAIPSDACWFTKWESGQKFGAVGWGIGSSGSVGRLATRWRSWADVEIPVGARHRPKGPTAPAGPARPSQRDQKAATPLGGQPHPIRAVAVRSDEDRLAHGLPITDQTHQLDVSRSRVRTSPIGDVSDDQG
jgi:hypothetical protein